jgi:hypothetical protein
MDEGRNDQMADIGFSWTLGWIGVRWVLTVVGGVGAHRASG